MNKPESVYLVMGDSVILTIKDSDRDGKVRVGSFALDGTPEQQYEIHLPAGDRSIRLSSEKIVVHTRAPFPWWAVTGWLAAGFVWGFLLAWVM